MCVLVQWICNSSAARCSELPTPGEANETWASSLRASATSSGTERAGSAGVDAEDVGVDRGDAADRLEVANDVKRQVLVKARVDGKRARCHQQRVTVGRRLRHRLRADHAIGARPVLDNKRLPGLSHDSALRQPPARSRPVHRRRWNRHDQPHASHRVGLRPAQDRRGRRPAHRSGRAGPATAAA